MNGTPGRLSGHRFSAFDNQAIERLAPSAATGIRLQASRDLRVLRVAEAA